MRIIKTYKLFETTLNLDSIAKEFISDMSKIYDLRLGKPFDKDKANCAWFTVEFYNWAKSKGYDVKFVYFDSDIEAHIAPLINEMTIDFTVKQFTKNPNDNYLILNPEDYKKFGYNTYEVYDQLPKLETIFPADKIVENMNLGIESNYGIHDWIEDLKSFEWGRKQIKDLKKWTDHFIGDSYYEKIKDRVDKIFVALNKVDIDLIQDRMQMDVFDDLPTEKGKYVTPAIAYGDSKNYNRPVQYRYNGLVTAIKRNEHDKLRIMVHIIKEIVFPTFYVGSYPQVHLRRSDESYFVTEPKWQCANFNIDDFQELGIKIGAQFSEDDYKGRKSIITEYEINQKRDYSIDKIIEMYVPCVVIDIGRDENYMKYKMNLSDIEEKLDEALPSILPTLDYSDVVFDHARGSRMVEITDIYDYTVKILLNF